MARSGRPKSEAGGEVNPAYAPGVYGPNRPFTERDRALIAATRPASIVLRASYEHGRFTPHGADEAAFCRSLGIQMIVVYNAERDDYHEPELDLLVATFGRGAVIQIGNEPDQGQPPASDEAAVAAYEQRMWTLRHYLTNVVLVWARRNPDVRLLPPPLAMGNIGNAVRDEAWQHHEMWLDAWHGEGAGRWRFADLYRDPAWAGVAVHAYDWAEVVWIAEIVRRWHNKIGGAAWLTEFGLSAMFPGDVIGNQPMKIAEYCKLQDELATMPYVAASAMFIAGDNLPNTNEAGVKVWPDEYKVGPAVINLMPEDRKEQS